jgi:hypothetical protein
VGLFGGSKEKLVCTRFAFLLRLFDRTIGVFWGFAGSIVQIFRHSDESAAFIFRVTK